MRYYILHADKSIKQVSLEHYLVVVKDEKSQNLRKTELFRYYISTCFLGLDYNHLGTGEPLVFETMVFELNAAREIDWSGIDCIRCGTYDEAMKNHDKLIAEYTDLVPLELAK